MAETNPNSRLEAFCDGVFAIALTLLILDIKIPPSETINNNAEFWLALKHLAPSAFAFVLSFVIILITWVNHHNGLKMLNKSSPSFIYANGLLLLTVVIIPFPTALLGQYIFTDHAVPAVILYTAVLALQAIAWILMTGVTIRNHLAKNESAALMTRKQNMYGYYGFSLYIVLGILAVWFPLTVAIVTTFIWIFWLVLGISLKHE